MYWCFSLIFGIIQDNVKKRTEIDHISIFCCIMKPLSMCAMDTLSYNIYLNDNLKQQLKQFKY